MAAHPPTIRCTCPIKVGRLAAVAVLEPRHLKSVADEGVTEAVVPILHVGAYALDQQQRIPVGPEALVGQVNIVVVSGQCFHRR
jgi:hypothetical protein